MSPPTTRKRARRKTTFLAVDLESGAISSRHIHQSDWHSMGPSRQISRPILAERSENVPECEDTSTIEDDACQNFSFWDHTPHCMSTVDLKYCSLLEEAKDGFMKAFGGDQDTIMIYAMKNYDEVKEQLSDTEAVLVVIRKVQCSDGYLIALDCQCDNHESAGLRGTRTLIFEDRPNVSVKTLLERHGGLDFVLQGCRHRRALVRLVTGETSTTEQKRNLSCILANARQCVEPHDAQLCCVIRRPQSDGFKYFTIVRKDSVSGHLTPARIALGVRTNDLALGYWTGSKLFCLSCNSADCGHFRASQRIYLAQGIDGGRRYIGQRNDSKIEVPKLPKIFNFDPGKLF